MNTNKPSYRQDRVAKVLSDALAKVLDEHRGFMKLPLLTISHIKMSPDLKIAKVYFSFYTLADSPEEEVNYEEKIESTLNSHSKLLRREISRKVSLRSIPELRFHYDQLLREADRLLNLIDDVKNH
ncbi:MAG: 30S ribosome-binding factor RbfA [Candidatus Portiera sp.]|nr:30S ribosome-binding factor RbfA [Portiera sp.]